MDANLNNQLYTANSSQFTGREYQVGTLLASALYQAAEDTGKRELLQRAVYAGYSDSSTSTPGLAQLTQLHLGNQSQFTLAVAASAIIRHIGDDALKKAVCVEFMDHLQIPPDQLIETGVCPVSTRTTGNTCRNING
jgi:hypothetical protein